MNKEEKKATRQSYGEELANLGEKNNKVVVLDADLSAATKTSIFAKKFPGVAAVDHDPITGVNADVVHTGGDIRPDEKDEITGLCIRL